MTGCNYFDSEEWERRLRTAATTHWDVRDFAAKSGLVDDEEAFRAVVEEFLDGDETRPDPRDATLTDVEDAATFDFDPAAVASAWVDRWDVDCACDREPIDGGDRCLFHADVDRKDPEAVRSAFVSRLDDPETSSFTGAKFGAFDLSDAVVGAASNHEIDLRYASFERLSMDDATVGTDVDLSFATVDGSLSAESATFRRESAWVGLRVGGAATFVRCRFAGRTTFTKATFDSAADFRYTAFERSASFRRASFESEFSLRDADFEDVLAIDGATFDGPVELNFVGVAGGCRFPRATFASEADFHEGQFARGATFRDAVFEDEAKFAFASFGTGTTFAGTRFESDATFRESRFGRIAKFDDTTFAADAEFTRADFDRIARFDGTAFGGDASFVWAQFDEIARFTDATFDGGATFRDARIATLQATNLVAEDRIEFRGAEIDGGGVEQSAELATTYDLTEATLGDVTFEFEGRRLFERVLVSETEFDGFQFSAAPHRRQLNRGWDVHRDGDDNQQVENTYLKAKNGAMDVGDNRAASAFFRREMKYRRKGNFDTVVEGEGLERVGGALKWVNSWLFNLTCGYGERPSNTVLASGGTVLLFAAVMYALGVRLPGPEEYVIVSIQSFVALILGELPASGIETLRLVTSAEAFVGAFFIGLFVFTLTRSIHR